MEMSLKNYRDDYLELFLHFLWREWTALGVAGQTPRPVHHVIDPEALLLLTCIFGRYDQRLFDEVLDWLMVNGRFLNVQRMRNVMRKENLVDPNVLWAIAGWLSRYESDQMNLLAANDWNGKNHKASSFFPTDALPEPSEKDSVFWAHGWERNRVALRRYSQMFTADAMPCLFLKFRAMFGVNARCDVLAYLTMNRTGYPREIAREMYYSQKAIHEILTDLAASGLLQSAKLGRERTFRIGSAGLPFLVGENEAMKWINWPVLFSIVNSVWKKIEELRVTDIESLLESAEITLTLKPLLQRLVQSSWAPPMPPFEGQQGLPLLQVLRDAFEVLAK